jgi:hypothetical protein
MVNICELMINSVIVDKPKMLTGLNQKVRGRYVRCPLGHQGQSTTGKKSEPNPFVLLMQNKVNPLSRPQEQVNRKEDRWDSGQRKDGKSEGFPVMGGIGVATSPHAKAGRLPSRSLITRALEEPIEQRKSK